MVEVEVGVRDKDCRRGKLMTSMYPPVLIAFYFCDRIFPIFAFI
jgi:hypothetical protein